MVFGGHDGACITLGMTESDEEAKRGELEKEKEFGFAAADGEDGNGLRDGVAADCAHATRPRSWVTVS